MSLLTPWNGRSGERSGEGDRAFTSSGRDSSAGDDAEADAEDDEDFAFIAGDGATVLRNSDIASVSALFEGLVDRTGRVVKTRLVGEGVRRSENDSRLVSPGKLGDGLGFLFTGDVDRLVSPAIEAMFRTARVDPNADLDGDDVGEIRGNLKLAAVGDDAAPEVAAAAVEVEVAVFSLAGFAAVGGGLFTE